MNTPLRTKLSYPLAAFLLLLASTGVGLAAGDKIIFAEPSWPGINVKTEIAEQLLDALGYQTKTMRLNLPFIYRSLAQGDTDVFLGAWLPAQNDMLDPLAKQHKIVKLGSNLSGAIEGLAVPAYAWKNGVHSVKDLAAHGDRFDHKIYGIESGSAMNQAFNQAIKNNYEGLGGWQVVPSSTAVMLTQVKRSSQKKQAIVFFGWRPHWMNVAFDIRYLQDKKDSQIARIKSQVLTLATASLPQNQPNVARFLRRFHVDAATQSGWINRYSHEKQKKSEVAHHWLATHEKTVAQWLDGVKTANGGSAISAYRQKY